MSIKRLFNDGWQFLKTGLDTTMEAVREQEGGFQSVDIPHDWLIYNIENLYEDGCGWYIKRFWNNADTGNGKRVWLRFDGVYMDCEVFLNGNKLKEWKYGYSTFDVDLSRTLIVGENEILVKVRHQAPNSRWYSGAGIYRNVWLRECEELFLTPDGSYVVSRPCEEGYLLEVETEVSGKVGRRATVGYSLWLGEELILDMGHCAIGEDGKAFISQIVNNPYLWDIEEPSLYQLQVALYDGVWEEAVDQEVIQIGFRSVEFNPDLGLLLNGRRIKVNGVCEHHDFGCLGAAFSTEAMRRKMRKLREMGVNGIRTSHNMPAPELMELADEMGFLVVNEAFDMWERSKTEYDYARYFKEWVAWDVASWVRRDRNHPSLLLWSIGNEIYDTHADIYGQEITRKLTGLVKLHDPRENGRVTIGSNYMAWENAQKCAELVKVAGYNYGERYYDLHHEKHPDWIIYGSETGSVVQSRGVYHFPLSQPVLSDEDEQCSALGNSTTSWGAKNVEALIITERDTEYSFGQFIWTGFDYIGEPTPYNTKNSYFGHLDTAGFAKDSYYIFMSEWTDVKKQPMVHVFPYWDFNEGQLIDVRACTNGAAVELFVNGESQGKQKIDHANGEKLLGEWKVPYRKGYIKAVAYDESGKVIAQKVRHSYGEPMSIVLQAEKEVLRADGEDLCFLTITVTDEFGNPVENAMNYVTVRVDGPGRLLGLDNGDSTDYDSYKGDCRKLFNGKLLAVIGTYPKPGTIRVMVSGEGLAPAYIILYSAGAPVRPGVSATENLSRTGDEDIENEDTYLDSKDADGNGLYNRMPVRKIELQAAEGQILTKEKPQALVEARVYPENAADFSLIWKAVNEAGIEISYASVQEVTAEKENVYMAQVTARGAGDFYVRCTARDGSGKSKLISQLEYSAKGMEELYINPYDFVVGGLFTEAIGDLGNGNEQGIATSGDGISGAVYSNLDFGDYGSDEITIPVFALSDEEYPIEIWLGKPGEEDSELLLTQIYQKPSIWAVYQEVTWKLPRRIKGIKTIAFLLRNKVHIKGFQFRKYNKAFIRWNGADCSRIYGDSYKVGQEAVTRIGNNVVLEFDDMDFGQEGTGFITICGKTDLPANTIHIQFTQENGEKVRQIVEFAGSSYEGLASVNKSSVTRYLEQKFELEVMCGKGKVEFIFLPGSRFDFHWFCFEKA